MVEEAIILDGDGIPWTPERFSVEPQSAQAFLAQLESQSYGILKDWRDWMHDKIITEAAYRLHLLQQDLVAAEFLKSKDALH